MLRHFVAVLAVVCLVAPGFGCGGGGEGGQTASKPPVKPEPQGQSRPAIPQKEEQPETVVGVEINPYFDEHGVATRLAVGPGDRFTLYIFAQYEDPFHVSAAEFRFDLPEGVRILSEHKFADRVLTMGGHESDFVMAFQCKDPGKFYLIKYECLVEDGFKGGEIAITPGVNDKGQSYLGLVACEPETRRLPAKGGTATLTMK